MEKHLLVTVGSSGATSDSLRFVHKFFGNKCQLRLTLFYVASRSQAMGAAQGPEAELVATAEAARKTEGSKVMDESKRWLKAHGCSLDMVEAKVIRSRAGTVRKIIQEATVGLYDAVVIGRRGLSWMSELVDESVSHRLMWEELDFPLWLCRRTPAEVAPSLLICLDGSDAGYRMADHAGFMLGDQPEHTVTLLHVGSGGADDIFDQGLEKLTANGFPRERVQTRVERGDIVDSILDVAKAGSFGAVAVGRKAGAPSARERLFPGSVSTRLLRSLERAALWVSH